MLRCHPAVIDLGIQIYAIVQESHVTPEQAKAALGVCDALLPLQPQPDERQQLLFDAVTGKPQEAAL